MISCSRVGVASLNTLLGEYIADAQDCEDGWYRLTGWAVNLNFTDHQWALLTERVFTCPKALTNKYRVQHRVPAWHYRHFRDLNNTLFYNTNAGLESRGSSAYYGVDRNAVLSTAVNVSGLQNSPNQDATINYIQSAYIAFPRD
jgi:hypothetical protein